MDTSKIVVDLIGDFSCGYCSRHRGYDILYSAVEGWDEPELYFRPKGFTVVQCRNCRLLTLFSLQSRSIQASTPVQENGEADPYYLLEHPNLIDYDPEFYLQTWLDYQGQYPASVIVDGAVPGEIIDDLREAANCLAVGAPNAAVIMSRRVVERLARHYDPSISKREDLHKMLLKLKKASKIDDAFYEALFEVKEWGNVGAHAGVDEAPPSLEVAQKIVHFVTLLVAKVFPPQDTAPERLDELRTLRQRKT